MSYDTRWGHRLQVGTEAPISLTATGVATPYRLYWGPQRFWRFISYVTTATVSTGNIVVQAIIRPTLGSSAGQIVLATLNIPGAVPADTCYYKDFEAQGVSGGQLFAGPFQLVFNVQTAAAGGGAAGAALFDVFSDDSPQTALNQSKLVLSS